MKPIITTRMNQNETTTDYPSFTKDALNDRQNFVTQQWVEDISKGSDILDLFTAAETTAEGLARVWNAARYAKQPDAAFGYLVTQVLNTVQNCGDAYWLDFVTSLYLQISKRRTLSPKQEAVLFKAYGSACNSYRRRLADKASAPASPMEKGRYEFTGKVLSAKWKETDFGTSFKLMLVTAEGHKVYGTCPASLVECGDLLVGQTVRIHATVAPKAGENIAFYSRPSRGVVVN